MPSSIGLRANLLMLGVEGSPLVLSACDWLATSSTVENLGGRLAGHVAVRPDAAAITTAAQSWTYSQLVNSACQIAKSLKAQSSFEPGSRVVLLLGNSFDYIAAFFGTLLADGVVVPLPPNVEDQMLKRVLSSTDATTIVVPAEGKQRHAAILNNLPSERLLLGSESVSEFVGPRRGGNDLAGIFFTAGSTGNPKGVMLSHRNFLENANSIQQYLSITERDRPLCVLPFYHAFGNSVLQSHLMAGANLILDGKTLFPETLITAIAKHQATSLSAVPDLIRLLLERTSLGKTALPSLKYMTVAGGALQRDFALMMAERIAPASFFTMYGQTEATARLAYLPPEKLPLLPAGCIGRAVPGVELEVVDDNGVLLPAGEVGELRARGANLMLGYWNDPEGTAERMKDGWLMTGDFAARDAEGWIFHRGRKNAIVKIAGYRVHPGDLEEFALRRLSAQQAVVVPFEAPQVGTRLALYICKPSLKDLTLADMLAVCRAELPRHLVPNYIQCLEDYPLNAAMKVDRMLLSKIAERDLRGSQWGETANQAITG